MTRKEWIESINSLEYLRQHPERLKAGNITYFLHKGNWHCGDFGNVLELNNYMIGKE